MNSFCFTVKTFCETHHLSRGMLYKLWTREEGPKYIKVGDKRLISIEAAAEWRNAYVIADRKVA